MTTPIFNNTTKADPASVLPPEILDYTFQFLDLKNLNKVTQVSKEWRNIGLRPLEHALDKKISSLFRKRQILENGLKKINDQRNATPWLQTVIPLFNFDQNNVFQTGPEQFKSISNQEDRVAAKRQFVTEADKCVQDFCNKIEKTGKELLKAHAGLTAPSLFDKLGSLFYRFIAAIKRFFNRAILSVYSFFISLTS